MKLHSYLNKEDYKLGKIINIDKGNIIYRENDRCENITFLIEGEIIILSYNENGDEDIYNHLKEGDIFGNSLIFNEDNRYLGNVIASKKSKIFIISKNNFLILLKNNSLLLEAYLKKEASDTLLDKKKIKALSKHTIEEKIIYLLSINPQGLNISISELAKTLFIPRPSLSRSISKLIKEGKIIKDNKVLKLKNRCD